MTAKSKEELAQERLDARAAKDFTKADQLRDQIAALGFTPNKDNWRYCHCDDR
jgi:cysteinyl-tRNA synthetase